MKIKYGHIIIMAMLMSTACSHDSYESRPDEDVPVVDTRTAISFSGQQGEEQAVSQGTNRANSITRAGTPLSESARSFTVWGYKNMSYNDGTCSYGDLQTVFPGYIVNWNSATSSPSNSNGWEYVNQQTSGDEQTIKYWDWNAKAYRYFAVTGFTTHETNGAHVFTFNADASSTESINATPYYSRLWFSTGDPIAYADKQFGKPVQLEFLKPYARVRFLFNYSYAQEGVKVTSPIFKPTTDFTAEEENKVKIALKGTVKVSYPLIGTSTSETFTIEETAATPKLDAFTEEYIPEGTEKWYTVFPVASQGSYTMSVKVNNGDRTAVVPAEYMTWLPGYSYTYIFKITEDGGVIIETVQAAVTPWTELENEHSVYNW